MVFINFDIALTSKTLQVFESAPFWRTYLCQETYWKRFSKFAKGSVFRAHYKGTYAFFNLSPVDISTNISISNFRDVLSQNNLLKPDYRILPTGDSYHEILLSYPLKSNKAFRPWICFITQLALQTAKYMWNSAWIYSTEYYYWNLAISQIFDDVNNHAYIKKMCYFGANKIPDEVHNYPGS